MQSRRTSNFYLFFYNYLLVIFYLKKTIVKQTKRSYLANYCLSIPDNSRYILAGPLYYQTRTLQILIPPPGLMQQVSTKLKEALN